MTDTQVNMQAEVGLGSPDGIRWFISRYPELTITRVAEDWIKDEQGKVHKVKGKDIAFAKEVKPRRLRGKGDLSRDGDGTDLNDSVYWGILKTDDPVVIDFLRKHEYYRGTAQDNKLDRNMRLKELNWDPGALRDRASGLVTVKEEKFGPNDDLSVAPPDELFEARPKAKIGVKVKSGAK